MMFMGSPTNRIKEALIKKGIKQTWLAEKLGKSFTIVNSYVCNRRQPSLEFVFFNDRVKRSLKRCVDWRQIDKNEYLTAMRESVSDCAYKGFSKVCAYYKD